MAMIVGPLAWLEKAMAVVRHKELIHTGCVVWGWGSLGNESRNCLPRQPRTKRPGQMDGWVAGWMDGAEAHVIT